MPDPISQILKFSSLVLALGQELSQRSSDCPPSPQLTAQHQSFLMADILDMLAHYQLVGLCSVVAIMVTYLHYGWDGLAGLLSLSNFNKIVPQGFILHVPIFLKSNSDFDELSFHPPK